MFTCRSRQSFSVPENVYWILQTQFSEESLRYNCFKKNRIFQKKSGFLIHENFLLPTYLKIP